MYHSTFYETRSHLCWSPEFRVYSLSDLQHTISSHSLFPLRHHITPPWSSPRSPLSILSQSHLANMSWARLRDLVSGDGGAASEAETRRGISQKRLTGERGGGNWDGIRTWVFFFAVAPCCVTSVKPLEHPCGSSWSEERQPSEVGYLQHPRASKLSVQSDNPPLKFEVLECQKQEYKCSFMIIHPEAQIMIHRLDLSYEMRANWPVLWC